MERMIRAIADFGEHYWNKEGVQGGDRSWFRKRCEESWRSALEVFLHGYAFERAGRSPYYSNNAIAALAEYMSDSPGRDFPRKVWESFVARQKGKGLNQKNNPLYPADTGDKPVTQLVLDIPRDDHNIAAWAADHIEHNRAETAFDLLLAVRGVGSKIASFYLRDIATAFGIDPTHLQPVHCFQPIDVWTQRGAHSIARASGNSAGGRRGVPYAEVIHQAAVRANVSSLLVNTGLWYLGSNFSQSPDAFEQMLESPESFRTGMSEIEKRLSDSVSLLRQISSEWRE